MNKLEVGMYVRFKYPRYYVPIQISKIKSKEYDEFEKYYIYITDNGLVITDEEIIGEPSFNIIDLIEEHDVIVIKELSGDLSKYEVKEYEIVDIYSMKTHIKSLGIFIDNHYKSLQKVKPIIKFVVTKEQFESMEYEVI